MYYYEIEFNPTDELVDIWGVYEDSEKRVCEQTYLVQSEYPIEIHVPPGKPGGLLVLATGQEVE